MAPLSVIAVFTEFYNVIKQYDTHFYGADKRIRTSDLRITNAPLYQLSYVGSEGRQVYANQHATTTQL